MNAPIPKVSERAVGVAAVLDEPIAKMLAKVAADRPASVGEALASLQRAAGMPVDSARAVVKAETGEFSLDERAIARTVMADGTTPATFLGTETDIALTPAAKRGKAGLVVLAAAAALLLGGVITVVVLTKKPDAPAQGIVASSPSASTSASAVVTPAPVPTTVEINVDGVPPDTAVTADGTALGTGAGPFKLPKDKPVKLVFTAKGFKPKELALTPTESTLLSVTLEKAPAPNIPTAQTARRPTIHKDLDSFDSDK
jgi:hypothetical protein